MQTLAEKTQAGYVYLPGEGKSIKVSGEEITFKATSKDTKGAWTLMEFKVPPRFAGPPLHYHQKEFEGFYVLSGTLTLQLGERVTQVPAGSFALVPAGLVHTFSNQTAEPVTFLSILSPAGFERFIEELADMMQQETDWPPADMSRYSDLNSRYGMYSPSA